MATDRPPQNNSGQQSAISDQPPPDPTPRQVQVLREIAEYRSLHPYSPTIRELAVRLGISGCSTHHHIFALKELGLLEDSWRGKFRSFQISPNGQDLVRRYFGLFCQ